MSNHFRIVSRGDSEKEVFRKAGHPDRQGHVGENSGQRGSLEHVGCSSIQTEVDELIKREEVDVALFWEYSGAPRHDALEEGVHGQYGEGRLRLEPLPDSGRAVEFHDI